jgi:hypothetical protein
MQQVLKIARGLSSPAILMAVVWCATLIGVAAGPIDYPMQPSVPVLVLVAIGVSLFVLAHQAGAWCFGIWLRRQPDLPAPPPRSLNTIVTATSLLGLAGIALIALDRMILNGAGNGGYADLLRCAPTLVDFIEIKRTPLLYAGYLTFSFGFASLVLFLLRGDDIGGWAAILAQLSILSPVGYAVLYSGRMPILFIIVLIVAAMLVRIGQGRRPLPRGHHLLIKMVVVFLLFTAYSSAMWSSRQAFCVQMSGLIRELQGRMNERDLARAPVLESTPAERKQEPPPDLRHPEPANSAAGDAGRKAEAGATPPPTDVRKAEAGAPPADARKAEDRDTPPPKSADSISATDLRKMLAETEALPGAGRPAHSPDVVALLATMQDAWHVTPRGYVLSAIDSGRLSPNTAINFLSTYFYLTHGIRILDLTWHARARFSPHWGIYEIGVLSPILRVFFPQNQLLASMSTQLRSAEIYGFFPTVWAAAYIDFGAAGAVIYVLIWGFAAGWGAFGARHSALALPQLLLIFILASILLSPVQGPLGIANSAMVLVSMVIVGMAIDLESLRVGFRRQHREMKPGTHV